MDLQLRGQRALVTGSTAGIGHAIAARLAAEGAEVVITGRTRTRVDAAVDAVRAASPAAVVRGVAGDLGTEAGVAAAIDAAPDLDILVNNVGVFTPRPFVELSIDDWQTAFAVNVLSGVLLSRHHLPRMLARKRGRILFISSESALQIPTEMIQYGVSKTAQSALARGLAELTRATGVTVNSVLAGPTRSEGVERFVGDVVRAPGVDVAQVELAAAVNGAAVRADGGVVKTVF